MSLAPVKNRHVNFLWCRISNCFPYFLNFQQQSQYIEKTPPNKSTLAAGVVTSSFLIAMNFVGDKIVTLVFALVTISAKCDMGRRRIHV